jgi:hypothetical protein
LIGDNGPAKPLLSVSPGVKAKAPGQDQQQKNQTPAAAIERRKKNHRSTLPNYQKAAQRPGEDTVGRRRLCF